MILIYNLQENMSDRMNEKTIACNNIKCVINNTYYHYGSHKFKDGKKCVRQYSIHMTLSSWVLLTELTPNLDDSFSYFQKRSFL